MAEVSEGAMPAKQSAIQGFLASDQSVSFLVGLIIAIITVPFMVPLLPVEDIMAALGVFSIYFVSMILIGLLSRPFVRLGRRLLSRAKA